VKYRAAIGLYDQHAVAAGQTGSDARRAAVEIFLWSRGALWLAAVTALLLFEPSRHPRADRWDDPLAHDLGFAADVWARWDSIWFLRIAEHGYSDASAAFYPLYPALLWLLKPLFLGHGVLAGIALSLACCLAAFVLLARLAEERLGLEGARRAVLYVALFPAALFLQAVYAESLFLLLAVAAFLLVERGRPWEAGVVCGLAMLTRPLGFALLPALVLLARRDAWKLAAAPALFALFPLWLWHAIGDPWAFLHAQDAWHRRFLPLGGVWEGARAAWAGARQLASGSDTTVYWSAVATTDSDPDRVAFLNMQSFAFLILFVSLTIYCWRRFGAPYGLFCALGLAIPLSVPSERWPLLSLPRFGLVLFPLFLALAAFGERPHRHTAILGTSAVLLGVAVAQWATWQWVA
jgi:hypothetical protein